jgi:hypothetical protein
MAPYWNSCSTVRLRSFGASARQPSHAALSRSRTGSPSRSSRSEQRLVGPGRVERPTSRLSGVRSNHLSYEPKRGVRLFGTLLAPHDAATSHDAIITGNRRKGRETRTAAGPPVGSQKPESEVGETLPIVCFACLSPEKEMANHFVSPDPERR